MKLSEVKEYKGASGINIPCVFSEKNPKPQKKVPSLKKGVHGVDSPDSGTDGGSGE